MSSRKTRGKRKCAECGRLTEHLRKAYYSTSKRPEFVCLDCYELASAESEYLTAGLDD